MNDLTIIFGPPGTGKTTRLLNIIEKMLANGVDSRRIAFLTFSRRAAREAVERAAERFQRHESDFPWFRTIHSMAFRMLNLNPKRLIQHKHLLEIGESLGVEFSSEMPDDEMFISGTEGNRFMFFENLSRITKRSLRDVWEERDGHGDLRATSYEALVEFAHYYARYKMSRGLLDFSDAIEQFLLRGATPAVDYLMVDEAQDLSRMQWEAIHLLGSRVKSSWVVGDDDQAIYRWAGADVESFLALQGRTEILEQSHRVPAAIHNLADGIARRISHRKEKTFRPKKVEGEIREVDELGDVDLSSGTWLLLARHSYQLRDFVRACREEGLIYDISGRASNQSAAARAIVAWERLRKGDQVPALDAREAILAAGSPSQTAARALRGWKDTMSVDRGDLVALGINLEGVWHQALTGLPDEEVEYFLAARRRGEKLLAPPRIRISTIHGAKGAEADAVILGTDVSDRVWRKMQDDQIGQDDEARVFYVGVTRAANRLYVTPPRTALSFDLGSR